MTETEKIEMECFPETEVSKEMERVEKKATEENEQMEQDLLKKKETNMLQEALSEQRHKRLMHLLTTSEFYSQYLLQKIESQRANNNVPKNKRKRLKANDKENSAKSSSQDSQKSVKRSTRGGETSDSQNDEIITTGGTELSEARETQPSLFENGTLRSYQLDGYSWLKTLFENGVNGILADEMGLGKTIQCIALICHFVHMGIEGPFLVVAPLSTLPNWISEFRRFAPKVPTLLYHGNEKERKKKCEKFTVMVRVRGHGVRVCPVVITSYQIAIKDIRKLNDVSWRYMIVDEGHRLKNHKSRLSRSLCTLSTPHRLILTGTPLQNNLAELWALLNFLLPDIFNNLDVFESWFEIDSMMQDGAEELIVQQEREKQIVSTLHKILTPFLLRRVKKDIDLNIPMKKELLVYVPMTQLQLDLYKATITKDFSTFADLQQFSDVKKLEDPPEINNNNGRSIRKTRTPMKDLSVLNDDSESAQAFEKYLKVAVATPQKPKLEKIVKTSEINLNIRNVMMQCRKIVNHPYLLQYPLTPEGEYRIDEELLKSSGKLLVLDQILEELYREGHKVLLFSQMTKVLNIIEDYLSLRTHFKYKRLDGSVSLDDRTNDINEFNKEDSYFLYLLSTRAGGLGINLTAADTVIIYDSDWNPQQDLQAQDRCHRIGQTKPVLILRFIAASTIDQRIVERAAAKRKLEKMIMKSGKFRSSFCDRKRREEQESLDLEELLQLLQSSDHDRVHKASTGSGVYTSEELRALLDRRDLEKETTTTTSHEELKGVFKTITET